MIAINIVRIGEDGGRLDRVTADGVEYTDEKGVPGKIDLRECVRGWGKRFKKNRDDFVDVSGGAKGDWNSGCVGLRDVTAERPWTILTADPKIRLEFESRDELYAQLLDPLREMGWYTFDTT